VGEIAGRLTAFLARSGLRCVAREHDGPYVSSLGSVTSHGAKLGLVHRPPVRWLVQAPFVTLMTTAPRHPPMVEKHLLLRPTVLLRVHALHILTLT